MTDFLLSGEKMAKKLFPRKKVSILGISKKIHNDGRFNAWCIEYEEIVEDET